MYFILGSAIFIISLEGELNGFMLRCISCTGCLASDVIREEKLRVTWKGLQGNCSISSPLKRQSKLSSALKLMICVRELVVSNPVRAKSVPIKDIPF